MKWAQPSHKASAVDSAGNALAAGFAVDSDFEVISNWRSSHSFPLQVIKMMLKGRAKKADTKSKPLVSQRLKRLASIKNKLARETIRLSQMQDVGGCRAVMSDIASVNKLVAAFEEGLKKNPKGRHEYAKPKDYIACPKKDGYRSVHFIVRYRGNNQDSKVFNGRKIEIQIRSRLQHAWATSVETVDALTGRSLKFDVKSNIEDPRWKRFFSLMGSAIALREKTPAVPGTPEDRVMLVRELRELAKILRVEDVLGGFSVAVSMISDKSKLPQNASEYILILNTNAKRVSVIPFTEKQLSRADAEYLRQEKDSQGKPHIQVVRVSVEDVKNLRTAYPNYYLDTREFLNAMRIAIAKD
jgi:ppGpp synthetase/RelA/SpoT-type nucleotidyltranferase